MSLIVLAVTVLALLFVAPDVVLIVFAGLLFGTFFGGGGGWLSRHLGIGRPWGIALFIALIALAVAAAAAAFAPAVVEQVDQLTRQVPEALDQLRDRIEGYSWGQQLLDRATPGALIEGGGGGAASAVATTFGAVGNGLIMLIVGLYVALDPDLYRRGAVALLAPDLRDQGRHIVTRCADTLSEWLVAQLMSMAVVGLLTWAGLWLVGIPLAPVLGLIAALLAFIPNIGPILAAAPAVLLGFVQGPATAGLVVGAYLVVQTLESYAITPLIQQSRVALPPVLIIFVQLLMGVMFGILGLALATPLAALALTLTREVYVERYLDRPGP